MVVVRGIVEKVWQVVALEPPRVLRRCSRCDETRPFVSSGRFRVNAQKRRLDVWLVYRCAVCEDRWNFTIVERATPQSIGAERLAAFHANDADAAFACAARAGVTLDDEVRYRVDREAVVSPSTIVLAVARPCPVRLERLLATELAVSRTRVRRMVEDGSLVLAEGVDVRRTVADGQRFTLRQGAG
jgi:hypothetical protein